MILNENEILVLKACESYYFALFEVGTVIIASDCDFYGLPWGEGSAEYLLNHNNITWMLVAVDTSDNYIHCCEFNTCKFKFGRICYIGDRIGAIELLQKHVPENTKIVYANQVAGNKANQVAGYLSTQTAGYESVQIAGNESTQIAGDGSTQTAGYASTQRAGYDSAQTAGDASVQIAGYRSAQTAGEVSVQAAGDGSAQTAGDGSTQIVGNNSYQCAGLDTVQTTQWYDNDFHKAVRVITEAEANIWHYVENGIWIKKDIL